MKSGLGRTRSLFPFLVVTEPDIADSFSSSVETARDSVSRISWKELIFAVFSRLLIYWWPLLCYHDLEIRRFQAQKMLSKFCHEHSVGAEKSWRSPRAFDDSLAPTVQTLRMTTTSSRNPFRMLIQFKCAFEIPA